MLRRGINRPPDGFDTVPDNDFHSVCSALDNALDPNSCWTADDVIHHRKSGHSSGLFTSLRLRWAMVNTPLHRAVLSKQLDTATLLLDRGAQMDSLNALGKTALHEACQTGLINFVTFLIDRGANLNAVSEFSSLWDLYTRASNSGLVPLQEAINVGNVQIAEKLIAAGANVNFQSHTGWTPLDLAIVDR